VYQFSASCHGWFTLWAVTTYLCYFSWTIIVNNFATIITLQPTYINVLDSPSVDKISRWLEKIFAFYCNFCALIKEEKWENWRNMLILIVRLLEMPVIALPVNIFMVCHVVLRLLAWTHMIHYHVSWYFHIVCSHTLWW